jgi:proteic killer suppression protein
MGMEVCFYSAKMKRLCSSDKLMRKKWGVKSTKKLKQRFAELRAASSLAIIDALPAAGLHPLKGDRRGQLAVDAGDALRLVLEPNHNPIPKKEDGSLDLSGVTSVAILDVVNYHKG